MSLIRSIKYLKNMTAHRIFPLRLGGAERFCAITDELFPYCVPACGIDRIPCSDGGEDWTCDLSDRAQLADPLGFWGGVAPGLCMRTVTGVYPELGCGRMRIDGGERPGWRI